MCRGVKESNEGCSRQRARSRSGRGARSEWRGSLVRRNRPGRHCRKSCRQLRHGIPRGLDQQFVALALLKLQEEGKINLYARLQDVAPEIPFKNRWEATHPVRIVNLLEHTAGFDDMEFSEVYNLRDRYDFPLLDVFKRFQKPQIARWPPGTRMSYSNPGNAIAGYLIEKVTGKPFDQYIRDTFLRPLGLARADHPFTDANKPLLAAAYNVNPPKAVGYPFIYLRPAGDLKASPGELAKLVQFLLPRGRT